MRENWKQPSFNDSIGCSQALAPPDAHEIISIYTDKIIERVSIYTASWDPLEYPHT
jgi:hypothetical protein